MSETRTRLKPPRAEAAPLSRTALHGIFFWLGIAALMLILLFVLKSLAARDGDRFSGLAVILWMIIFVGWPGGIGVYEGYRYRQALKLEQNHIILIGTVIGFYAEDTSVGDQAPSEVFWVIFTLDGSGLIKQRVSQKTYQQLHDGDQIPVRVLPGNRSICRADWAEF